MELRTCYNEPIQHFWNSSFFLLKGSTGCPPVLSELDIFMAQQFACPKEEMVLLSVSVLCSGHHPAVMKFPSGIIMAYLSKPRPKHPDCLQFLSTPKATPTGNSWHFKLNILNILYFAFWFQSGGNDVWQMIRWQLGLSYWLISLFVHQPCEDILIALYLTQILPLEPCF